MRLFFDHPDQSFYMQEIGRIVGKKPGYFQRTINNLQNEGILTSKYLAHARFFELNKEYLLYNELKRVVLNSVGLKDGSTATFAIGKTHKLGSLPFCVGKSRKSLPL